MEIYRNGILWMQQREQMCKAVFKSTHDLFFFLFNSASSFILERKQLESEKTPQIKHHNINNVNSQRYESEIDK